jgi:O-antigen/teichoic acid export membrane protein
MATQAPQRPAKRGERFVKNVLWSWFGVFVSLSTGFVLTPYIIGKLGDEGYGVWALVFFFADYYWLLDLGMRSATLKYSAHYRATNEPDKINEIVNTGLTYASIVAVFTVSATWIFAPYASRFFRISPAYRDTFTLLIILIGMGWAIGGISSVFSACIEGFQRFDISSRVWMSTIALRSTGLAVVLAAGYGLTTMAMVTLASLSLGYFLYYLSVRRVFPALRFGLTWVKFGVLRQMLSYGIHTSVATVSNQLLNQGAPTLIGHLLPTAFVGYFAQPVRLMQYSVDLVGRVGLVTGSNAAEMAAKGESHLVARMALYVNRYCFTLFAPFAIAFTLYGREFFRVWLPKNPAFAELSSPLVPVLAVGTTLGIAAQYNSSASLYGLGRHREYARSLLGEAILSVVAMYFVIPRYGIFGAAVVAATLMTLNRGLFLAWLLCRSVGFNLKTYLAGIYLPPIGAAIPTLLAGWWIKARWLPGGNWFEVLAGGALVAALFYGLAFFLCLEKDHRAIPLRWVQTRFRTSAVYRSAGSID